MSDIIEKEIETVVVENSNLYEFSRKLIINSRKIVYQAANFAMVETYWKIGEKIVEEQGGVERSKYGDKLIAGLSKKLTAEFGKGFDKTNLGRMRQFYLMFPNVDALRQHLSWTHYRSLIRVENPKAREVYMNEAADNAWSTRFLDEQVDKHYYRMKNNQLVRTRMTQMKRMFTDFLKIRVNLHNPRHLRSTIRKPNHYKLYIPQSHWR